MSSQQTAITTHHVETPSGRISYASAGSGPVALFVHGVVLNKHLWRHQLAELSDIRFFLHQNIADSIASHAIYGLLGVDRSTSTYDWGRGRSIGTVRRSYSSPSSASRNRQYVGVALAWSTAYRASSAWTACSSRCPYREAI